VVAAAFEESLDPSRPPSPDHVKLGLRVPCVGQLPTGASYTRVVHFSTGLDRSTCPRRSLKAGPAFRSPTSKPAPYVAARVGAESARASAFPFTKPKQRGGEQPQPRLSRHPSPTSSIRYTTKSDLTYCRLQRVEQEPCECAAGVPLRSNSAWSTWSTPAPARERRSRLLADRGRVR
jgi:hypothetical protein